MRKKDEQSGEPSSRLAGKVAVVTAAGSGYGAASAVAMAEEGATVIAIDVREHKLEEIRLMHAGIMPFPGDVLQPEFLESLTESLSYVHILVNAITYVDKGTVLQCTDEAWDFSMNVNVKSVFNTTKALLPIMAESGGGSIINVSSIAGQNGAFARCSFSTAKAAIIGFTKSIATDFVSHNIRCNAICPGSVAGATLDSQIMKLGGDPEEVKREMARRHPMGRVGTNEDIAGVILFMASDESSYMTGTVQVVDGGVGLGHD